MSEARFIPKTMVRAGLAHDGLPQLVWVEPGGAVHRATLFEGEKLVELEGLSESGHRRWAIMRDDGQAVFAMDSSHVETVPSIREARILEARLLDVQSVLGQ
jgi:hypothetical protein